MTYFKEGQTVYTHRYGKGVVEKILHGASYCVIVLFESFRSQYTFDGREAAGDEITLSQTPLEPIVNKPIIVLKKGDLVWGRDRHTDIGWVAGILKAQTDKDFICSYPGADSLVTFHCDICVPFEPIPFKLPNK